MIKVMPRKVARCIQSGLGKLKVSEARYEDLPRKLVNTIQST